MNISKPRHLFNKANLPELLNQHLVCQDHVLQHLCKGEHRLIEMQTKIRLSLLHSTINKEYKIKKAKTKSNTLSSENALLLSTNLFHLSMKRNQREALQCRKAWKNYSPIGNRCTCHEVTATRKSFSKQPTLNEYVL